MRLAEPVVLSHADYFSTTILPALRTASPFPALVVSSGVTESCRPLAGWRDGTLIIAQDMGEAQTLADIVNDGVGLEDVVHRHRTIAEVEIWRQRILNPDPRDFDEDGNSPDKALADCLKMGERGQLWSRAITLTAKKRHRGSHASAHKGIADGLSRIRGGVSLTPDAARNIAARAGDRYPPLPELWQRIVDIVVGVFFGLPGPYDPLTSLEGRP